MQHAKHTIKKGVLLGMVSAVLVSSAADNDQSLERAFQQLNRQIIQDSRVAAFLQEKNEAAAGAAPSTTEERLACMQPNVPHRVKISTSFSFATIFSYIPKFPAPQVAKLLNMADFVGSTRDNEVRALAANLVDRNTCALHLIDQEKIRQLLTEERKEKEVLKSRSAALSELFASQLLHFNALRYEENIASHHYVEGFVLVSKVGGKGSFLLDVNKKEMKPVACMPGDVLTKNWIVNMRGEMFTYQSTNDLCVRDIGICWKRAPLSSRVNVINDCTFMTRNMDEVAVIKLDKDGTAPRVKIVEVDHSYRYDIVGDKLLFFSCEDAQQKEPILAIDTTDMVDYEPKADFSLMLEREYKTPYIAKSVLFEGSIKPIDNGLFEVSVIEEEVSIKDKLSSKVLQTYKPDFRVKSICLTRDHILSIEGFGKHGARNGECVSILMLNQSFEDAESWKKYQEKHPWLYTLLRTVLRR